MCGVAGCMSTYAITIRFYMLDIVPLGIAFSIDQTFQSFCSVSNEHAFTIQHMHAM